MSSTSMYVCFGKIINLNSYLTHFQIRVEKIWQTWLGRELHYLCSCCCFRLNINCQRLKPGPQLHRVAGDAAIWISFTPEAVLSPQQDRGARRQCFRWRWGNPGNVCQLCPFILKIGIYFIVLFNDRNWWTSVTTGSIRSRLHLCTSEGWNTFIFQTTTSRDSQYPRSRPFAKNLWR